MSAPLPADPDVRPRVPAAVLFAVTAGAIHALGFAPWTVWWVQTLSLTSLLWFWLPLLRAGPDRPNFGQLLILPFAFAAAWFSVGLCWLYISMHDYGNLPAVIAGAAVLLLSSFLALFACTAFAATALCRSYHHTMPVLHRLGTAVVFGAAWTLAEWLRGVAFTGFPWIAIGYAHVDSPLAGWAPLIGVYGLSGIAAFLAFVVADLALNLRKASAGYLSTAVSTGAVVLVGACGLLLSTIEWSTPTGGALKVRLLQGNVPQQLKFVPLESYRAMQSYSRMVAQRSGIGELDLTVLPETAWTIPWAGTDPALIAQMFPPNQPQSQNLHHVAIGMPLPVGADRQNAAELTAEMILQRRIANSVLLLRSDRPSDQSLRYDKHHLVPFGEFVPFGFQWFVNMMNIPLGSFARGSLEQQPFLIKDQRVAFNICYEDLFGEQLARSVRLKGGQASILVNVSNIAWFGRSHALGQHLQIARMRTLELARPMLRATNTGMTASIDSRGKVRAILENHSVGVLEDEVQGMTGETPFAKWVHWPALGTSILILICAFWRHRRIKVQSH